MDEYEEEEIEDDRNDPVDDREDDFPEFELPVGEINEQDTFTKI